MINVIAALALVLVNIIIYFLFGCVLCASKKREMSLTRTVFAGFFFYFFLFALCCIPVMLRWRPLHVLTRIWIFVILLLCVIGAVRGIKSCKPDFKSILVYINNNRLAFFGIFSVLAVFAAIVIISYQFTLDASFYVGSVTTALQTDTVNMYDPFTGDWLDHYEMRYFFATFPMNDAVMCSIFHVHPLIWCKITMSAVAIVLTFMLLYMIGRQLFDASAGKLFLFILFASIANFFMITIYTTATFLTTRNYEGKCLLGNVVLPGIIYIYIMLLKNVKDRRTWMLLFLLALGSPVLSSSSNMLVPAMIGVTILPLAILRKDITVIFKSALCMLPGIILTAIYILYVKNIVVFYTYPRL
ncbi:MAG: hypothetical protein K6G03_02970 [Lachnospiraceae bacterium]|nr:hypothetical protein [Lachnospiraceae bacterium]